MDGWEGRKGRNRMEGKKREGGRKGKREWKGRDGRNERKWREEGKAGKGRKDGSKDLGRDGKIPDGNIMYWRRGRGRETAWNANFSVSIVRPTGRGGQLRRINIDRVLRNVVVGHGSVDIRKTTCFP